MVRMPYRMDIFEKNFGRNLFALTFVLSFITLMITILMLLDLEGELGGEFEEVDELLAVYNTWLLKNNRTYNTTDDKRYEIFLDNLWFIIDHNTVSNRTYKLELNQFADMTNEEYRSMMLLGGKMVRSGSKSNEFFFKYETTRDDELPDSIDWRDRGAVSPVKDQGQSGAGAASSWAVSTVEGINRITTDELIPLSEQELVDCDKTPIQGCNSSSRVDCQMDYAFEFVVKNGGIHTEDDYPYKGVQGQSDPNMVQNSKVVTINGYENVPQNDENSLRKAVAHQPVSVAIKAGDRAFQFYGSGVFTGLCGTELDHVVVAVGYGTADGIDFWIVKNSWGPSWGENGYVRLERNVAGTNTERCGIAMQPSYPRKNPKQVCDEHYSCPELTTCCCVNEFGNQCYDWGCCPLESATCCDDHSTCCPQEFPVCDINAKQCLLSKDIPVGVKALKRSPARPSWPLKNAERRCIGACGKNA